METKYSNIHQKLTKREIQIATQIVGFESFKEIAPLLCISERTLRKHASNIYAKLDLQIRNRQEFRKTYPRIAEYFKTESGFPKPYDGLNKQISLEWLDDSSFEDYFIEFSRVIQAMSECDFSEKMLEAEDENSFTDFIAKSLNTLNDELERQYLNNEIITDLLDAFNLKNRIIILSKDGQVVNHISVISEEIIIRKNDFIGKPIKSLFKNYETEKRKLVLNPKMFLSSEYHYVSVKEKNIKGLTILALTIHPEQLLEELAPRILSLITTIREQHHDNPQLYNSVISNSISIESEEIYSQLEDFILTYKN